VAKPGGFKWGRGVVMPEGLKLAARRAEIRGRRPRAEVGFLGRGSMPLPRQLGVWGALCELPYRGSGRKPDHNRILGEFGAQKTRQEGTCSVKRIRRSRMCCADTAFQHVTCPLARTKAVVIVTFRGPLVGYSLTVLLAE